MPGKKKDDEYSKIEPYKKFETYKKLKMSDDEINRSIQYLYLNNVWNLKDNFENYKQYLRNVNDTTENAWLNNIQYLDYKSYPKALNKISLKEFQEGKYIDKYIEKKKKISPKTDEKYAKRITFWTKTFEPFQSYQDKDNLMWIVKNNKRLLYEIFNYHNKNNHSISTLNSDFKALVRIIKLLLGPENELRYKYSALQTGLTDIENMGDDFNNISSQQEVNQFVLYEHLLDIIDTLEQRYITTYNQLKPRTRNNPLKHPNDLFNIHQDMIALAMYTWDFPSRFEKYGMEYIKDIKYAKTGKNYILLPKGNEPVKLIFNEIKKDHKPIDYYLNIDIPILDNFNKRLSELLIKSYNMYPRKYLFVGRKNWKSQNLRQIEPSTVATWLRNLIPSKNIGVDGLRSAFVSYYLTKLNNTGRKIMAHRMRTSVDIMHRSYFKNVYNSFENSAKGQIKIKKELEAKLNTGTTNNPIDVNNPNKIKVKKEAGVQESIEIPTEAIPIKTKKDINRDAWDKWYSKDKNKELHRERVKKSNNPLSYAKRMVRELNANKISFNSIKQSTIDKYSIKKNDKNEYYTDLK
jgi:hypothetical protein